jgi:hypothetical protein
MLSSRIAGDAVDGIEGLEAVDSKSLEKKFTREAT